MPDDERGRTFSACCAACRWWEGDGGDAWPWDGEAARTGDWGYCARAEACASAEPPSLLLTTGYLRTESRFACSAWEPLDSGPQDAPESAQGPDTPGRGLPSRGGPFPESRAGVLDGVGDDSLSRRDRDLLKADFAAALADFAAALTPEAAERLADDLRAAADRARAGDGETADAGA